jgi:hypothetical protein
MTERPDFPTLVAIAIVAYALANVAHEGLGHGGACLAVGGQARSLSAIHFDCAEEGLSPAAARWLAAGGTLVNLLIGGLAWLGLRTGEPSATPGRYLLWLLMAVNLLQAAGYWF